MVNGGDPDIEPNQRTRFKCGVLYGLRDRVVPIASATAGVYLGKLEAVDKGHIALPKCASKEDPTYQVLKRFILDSQTEASQEPIRLAADTLSYHARTRVLAPELEWTRREHELIELKPDERSPDFLKCQITSTRIGGELRDEIVICLCLEGNAPSGTYIDYSYLYGKGMLKPAEYTSIGDDLRTASLKREDFEKLLDVKVRLDADMKGEILLTEAELRNGPGYALLRYPVPPEVRLKGRDNCMVLSLSSAVRLRQGWYGFRSTRTVVEEVELQLIAPFHVHLFSNFWWCDAREQEDILGKERFSSKITIPGPLPVGADVIWAFDPENAKVRTSTRGEKDGNQKVD